MRRFFPFFLLFIVACGHHVPGSSVSPSMIKRFARLEGEGKARLEVGEQSWVFSFEAGFPEKNVWAMALHVPGKGEEVFRFPGLEHPRVMITPTAGDFRWHLVQVLREHSDKQHLGYPQAGRDFVQGWHHLLRWLVLDSATPSCESRGEAAWVCQLDGQASHWSWDASRNEMKADFPLRPDWRYVVVFRAFDGKAFQRTTVEVVHVIQESKRVELRQELFFQSP